MKGAFSSTQGFIDSLSGIDIMPKREPTSAPLDKIQADPNQPRKFFDPSELDNLVASIRANGVVSAIGVLPAENGIHTIVYGERRWRAAKLAGLLEMPIAIVDPSKANVRTVQLVENIQRSRLSAEEVAVAIDDLAKAGIKTTEIASQLGMSKARVSEYRAVMDMPAALRSVLNATGAQLAYQLFGLWKKDKGAVEAFVAATPADAISRPAVMRLGEAVNAKAEVRLGQPEAASAAILPPSSAPRTEASGAAPGQSRQPARDGRKAHPGGEGAGKPARAFGKGQTPSADVANAGGVAPPHFIVQVGEEFGLLLIDRPGPDSKTALVAFDNGSEVRPVRLSEISIFEIVGS